MIEQQVRRIIFNLVACNQDDHVKNFAFIMNRQGVWSLSPAYDLCHAEGSDFTRTHKRACFRYPQDELELNPGLLPGMLFSRL
jgi:serine/threonine protein kinase HipA of HipAB toxin-antitoxin module